MQLIPTTRRPGNTILPCPKHMPERGQELMWHTRHPSLIPNHGFNCCLYTNVKIPRRDDPFPLLTTFSPTGMPQGNCTRYFKFTYADRTLHLSHKLSASFLLVSGPIIPPLPGIRNPGASFASSSSSNIHQSPRLQMLFLSLHLPHSMTLTLFRPLKDSC